MLTGVGYLTLLQHRDDLQREWIETTERLLRESGWTRSSNYPSARSLWAKTFPESTVQREWKDGAQVPFSRKSYAGVNTEDAIRIESAWRSYFVRDETALPHNGDD